MSPWSNAMPWCVLVVLTACAVVVGCTSETPVASLAAVPVSGLYLVWKRYARPALFERQLALATEPSTASPSAAHRRRRRRTGHEPVAMPRPQPASPADDDVVHYAERLLVQGRAALLTRQETADLIPADLMVQIREATDRTTCFVSAGPVLLDNFEAGELGPPSAETVRREETGPFRIDRTCVSNDEFLEFVADGGYRTQSLWCPSARDWLPRLVDQTGRPGPRYWSDGSFPMLDGRLPVVGVSWYEADAYARWAGRRLPRCAEWVRAALVPTTTESGRVQQRAFPWGDSLDPNRCLVGRYDASSIPSLRQVTEDDPLSWLVDVDYDVAPAAACGAIQMIGNVWEWTADDFPGPGFDRRLLADDRLFKTLRGGAYDTYHHDMARPAVPSGDLITARRPNVGFRCVWDG